MQTPQTSEGQAGAALGAAAGQDLTAIGGPHPLAEAVLLGALALLGLIGTEHLHTPPVFISAPVCPALLDGGRTLLPPPAVDVKACRTRQATIII